MKLFLYQELKDFILLVRDLLPIKSNESISIQERKKLTQQVGTRTYFFTQVFYISYYTLLRHILTQNDTENTVKLTVNIKHSIHPTLLLLDQYIRFVFWNFYKVTPSISSRSK